MSNQQTRRRSLSCGWAIRLLRFDFKYLCWNWICNIVPNLSVDISLGRQDKPSPWSFRPVSSNTTPIGLFVCFSSPFVQTNIGFASIFRQLEEGLRAYSKIFLDRIFGNKVNSFNCLLEFGKGWWSILLLFLKRQRVPVAYCLGEEGDVGPS